MTRMAEVVPEQPSEAFYLRDAHHSPHNPTASHLASLHDTTVHELVRVLGWHTRFAYGREP